MEFVSVRNSSNSASYHYTPLTIPSSDNHSPDLPDEPKIFHVNWFRKNADGKFLWPGYRDNMRVLKWIVDRAHDRGEATETPIGRIPNAKALGIGGPGWSAEAVQKLLAVDIAEWYNEVDEREEFRARLGTKLPSELAHENEALRKRLQNAPQPTN